MSNLDRWLLLWKRIEAKGDPKEIYNKLVTLYSEPHRVYHNLSHIEHCLNELGQASHLLEHPDAVEMALWFHDAIYNTKTNDNEEKSAELACQILKKAGLSDAFTQKVCGLILATTHEIVPSGIDAQVMTDIDLSSLGKPKKEFDSNSLKIRKEYAWVPEEQFKNGRAAILLKFLKRPTIYSTSFFRQKYEYRARKNLIRSIIKLGYAHLM